LIANLATLDKPDFGLSPTLSGDAFAPIAGQEQAGAMMLTEHDLQSSATLKTLVTLGPEALPFLLEALDDQTPTKIEIKHDSYIGAMWHDAELPLNPVNPAERSVADARAAKARHEPLSDQNNAVKSYTVKVGDVCFVAIGQIVGRSYSAVRYQPTACIVLNCPSHDAALCAEVRAMWMSDDPTRKLFDSLLTDFATDGVFNGESLDGWGLGSALQCKAALRLLYYFPDETAALIAARLDGLNVEGDAKLDDYLERCVANRVRADDFIKAVAWSQDEKVRAALVGIFRRAGNVHDLLAATSGVDDNKLVASRVEPMLASLPKDDRGPFGDGYELLALLAQRDPGGSRRAFDAYLHDANAGRKHTVCQVLRRIKTAWAVDVLLPMLDDQATLGWTYPIDPEQNEPRAEIRVCDEAAVTLNYVDPDLNFTQAGSHADLDKQIAAIRATLAQKRGL
jgi:hypothetical protein